MYRVRKHLGFTVDFYDINLNILRLIIKSEVIVTFSIEKFYFKETLGRLLINRGWNYYVDILGDEIWMNFHAYNSSCLEK